MLINLKNENLHMVVDTIGAYINEFKISGKDIFYPKSIIYNKDNKKVRGGNHLCYPHFSNSSKLAQDQHGFARSEEWTIVEQTEDKVVLTLRTRHAGYEHALAKLTYELGHNSLLSKLEVSNLGKKEFTLSPAFHPYFEYENKDQIYVDGLRLEITEELDDSVFTENVSELDLEDRTFSFETKNLEKNTIWTDQLGNYICVEPTYNNVALAEDKELVTLGPGQIEEFIFNLYIEMK